MTASGSERARPRLSAEEKLKLAAEAALDLRAVDLVALDMRELTVITDYFLICHGTSNVHLRAIADRMQERFEEQRLRPRTEGYREAQWILLDYGDLVVHIFSEEAREFYSLERLWSDAPRTELSPPDERRADQS
jgi:ribosome-associated protein